MAGMDDRREAYFTPITSAKQTLFEILAEEAACRDFDSGREDEVNEMGMNVSPKNDSATEHNFQTLSQRIDDAFNYFDRIEHRISPVLTDVTPSEVSDRQGYPKPTGVSERLAMLCSRMDDLLYRMESVAARIDL